MKKYILVIYICVTNFSCIYAQLEFQITSGGLKKENSYHVIPTTDKGIFSIGSTESFGAGKSDVYLIKTDSTGKVEWTKAYGGTGEDYGTCIDKTKDGNYLILGYSYSFTSEFNDIILIKINLKGEVLWTRKYGLDRSDYSTFLQCTSDGGCVILGESINFIGNDKNSDILVIKVDEKGEQQWSKVYGGEKTDYAYSIQELNDGSFIVGGETNSYGAGEWDFYLLKLKAEGDVEWSKTYGGPKIDYGRYAQLCPDGGFMIGGNTQNFGAQNLDFCLVKTDAAGNVVWSKLMGGNGVDYLLSMRAGTKGMVFSGYSNSLTSLSEDACIVYVDYSGKSLWSKFYGSDGNDYGVSVNFINEKEIILGGSTNGFKTAGEDVFLVKTPLSQRSWSCNLRDFYPFTSKKIEVTTRSGHYAYDLYCGGEKVEIKVSTAQSINTSLCNPAQYINSQY